ncbi:TatD family hydrolase [Candidatus Berkelbacteria bacterium]|nr:TatD family hydrolase [Candidatus Berkelbacteria bacterium]
MELVDTHCHLNDPNLAFSVEEALANAQAAGVVQLVVPGMNGPTTRRAVELATAYPGRLFAAVGFHPHNVLQRSGGISAEAIAELRTLSTQPGVVAVGEIGIDYHHYDQTTRDVQREAFAAQLEFAVELDLPAIVHGRDAYADVLDVIQAHPRSRGVLHSFDAPYEVARAALDAGWLISLTAIITYRDADRLREVVRKLPLDRLMVETDTPYLPPQSIRDASKDLQSAGRAIGGKVIGARGRNNQPAYLPETARVLAELQGVDLETVAMTTTGTARSFFGLSI